MKYLFVLPASKYFSNNPEMLKKIQPGEVIEVILNPSLETALFCWKDANGKPCAYPEWMQENYTLALNQILSFFGKALE